MNFDSIYQLLGTMGYNHPIHPTITHLTIGLVMGALIFYLIALLPRYGKYIPTARHCSTLAFLAIFPTVILGLMDWYYYYGANWIFPIKMKVVLAGALALLLLLSIILNIKKSSRSASLLLVYLLSFFTVVGLGYFGGEVVYSKGSVKNSGKPAAAEKAASGGSASGHIVYADVENIFRNNCTKCHAGSNPPEGLDLTSYQNVMAGGQHGPAVIAGKPEKSELIKRVKGLSEPQMPLGAPALSDSDIRSLEKWIRIGAPGPEN